MTEKLSIAGTPLTPMEPDVEAKENRKEEELGNTPSSKENSIDPGERIRPGRTINPQNIPPDLMKSYIEIEGKYYFAGRPDSLAFEDRGRRLKTSLDNTRVAGSMVDIAEAKGWTEIRVRGKEAFRREAWLHAAARGIEVKGYMPRDGDLARLKKLVQTRTEKGAEERSAPEQSKDREDENRPAPVSPSDPQEKKEEQAAINARALLNEKENLVQLARENPDLVNNIAAIKMGEKLSRNISSDADRKRFMELVRERVAGNYLKGQGVPPIKIREERTIERPDREKEVENER